MFRLAVLIGIYSYIIFVLGIAGLLFKPVILITTILYITLPVVRYKQDILRSLFSSINTLKQIKRNVRKNQIIYIVCFLLTLQIVINFVGTLGPELGFDALWYHLTLAKIYLLDHKISYIPGGLLYYSAMPKLIEMLYITGIAIQNEIAAKVIHFSFGILSLIGLYKLSRRFFTKTISLLIILIFYSSLVVAWESITAYVDLGRTFYEIMALSALLIWSEKKTNKWLIISAIMLGFAITAKLLAVSSIIIFTLLIVYIYKKQGNNLRSSLAGIFIYWFYVLIVVLPWLVFSYYYTGNPVYPIFGGYNLEVTADIFSPIRIINDVGKILLFADDPISPVYIIVFPLVPLFYKKFRIQTRIITLYAILAMCVWYFTPRTGGGRFLMPYLPAFSLVVGEVLYTLSRNKIIKYCVIMVIIFSSFITILYRGAANSRYIPVIIGLQSKKDFLSQNLNFSFADFYDIDGFFGNTITGSDKVLLYGFHNLYYADFTYIDSSWVKRGDRFNYIAVQHAELPKRFKSLKRIYKNDISGVSVYTDQEKFYRY